ncbi:MAG: serine/threonine-protein phosphatase [Saprospiraceae bacterium]|nr:serine/threonine-protein phosphatase [Saprospiraceae bacterium]
MLFQFDALTDIGISRTIQQDNILTIPQLLHDNSSLTTDQYFDDTNGALFVVADGMGGGPHGELASLYVVEGIQDFVLKNKQKLNSGIYELIQDAIQHANQRIIIHLNEHPEDRSMGSTVVIGILKNGTIHLGWVGDSRCYLVNRNGIRLLTHDHSLVQSMVDEGIITEEEAFDHPRRNIIHQSLGMPEVIPSYEEISVLPGQKLIFCSDGLNSMLRNDEIFKIAGQDENIENTVTKLVDAANEAGGSDNISCIGVSIFASEMNYAVNSPESLGRPARHKPLKFPVILILICAGLVLVFSLVINYIYTQKKTGQDTHLSTGLKTPIKDESIMPMTDEDEVNPAQYGQANVEGSYIVRLKVFNDSMAAIQYLKTLQTEDDKIRFSVNHSANGLYEITTESFPDRHSAGRYAQSVGTPDAVVIFKPKKK